MKSKWNCQSRPYSTPPTQTCLSTLVTPNLYVVDTWQAVVLVVSRPWLTGEIQANDDLRAQYRYLDLRRPELANNLKTRSKVAHIVRCHLHDHGTPCLDPVRASVICVTLLTRN